jgi:hypothetical protein
MIRTFTVGQKFRATCEAMREERTQSATVLLASPNNRALVLEFEQRVWLRTDGGVASTPTVPLSQNPDGSITDLWGNPWTLEDA